MKDSMGTPSPRLSGTAIGDLTTFVGRRREVAAVRELLAATRMVTLIGAGGVGKTRLAFRVAREVRRAFPDGISVVELAPLSDPLLLPHAAAEALEIREQSARSPTSVLLDFLHQRRMLLILDNCEHLIDAVAELADRILRAAPDVRILATSREVLRIAGEHIYPVPPLPVPSPDERLEPGAATQYPAVALFADRSAAVLPGFAITPQNEAAVIRLCQRLEGIPLAIELASTQLRVLTVHDLANRLDDRFRLLRQGSRNLPKRHQSLQGLIDWSYNLCTPAEQALWARASVFVGGFGTDALEAVCTDEALPDEAVLDTVAGLVDKSIFIREEHEQQMRFRMLEVIRVYGAAQLAGPEEVAFGRRHRDWYQQLVERASDEWIGPRQHEWAHQLRWEHANLRRALEFCLSEPGETRAGLRMAAAWFWGATGLLSEQKLWLDRALSLDETASPERARALATAAYLAALHGDEEALRTVPEAARALAVEVDDPAALALANHVVALRQCLGPDPARSIPLFAEALEQYVRAGAATHHMENLQTELALAYMFTGELDRASDIVDGLINRCVTSGERWLLSYALSERGFLKLTSGALADAEKDLCDALIIKRAFHDTLGMAFVVEMLALIAAAAGDAKRAETLLDGMSRLCESIGAQRLLTQHGRFESVARKAVGDAEFDMVRKAVDRRRSDPPVGTDSAAIVEEIFTLALRERPQSRREATRSASALTRREREVATLVADGLSNKEIAARLVISLRTAEGHVEKILTKLGFNSRSQVVRWVVQQKADQP